MSWKGEPLSEQRRAAIELLGDLPWETAYRDSQDKEYRILRLQHFARDEEHDIQAALDTLTITHEQKQMAPYKGARRAEYTPVIKVNNWRSVDSLIKMHKNPGTTMLEIQEAVLETAALTCFERVFPDSDDFLKFQAMLASGEVKDHVNGGLLLRIDMENTTIEGLLEILKRSGLDINQIDFSYEGRPETVFVPNEAFPDNVRPVTVYDDDETQLADS